MTKNMFNLIHVNNKLFKNNDEEKPEFHSFIIYIILEQKFKKLGRFSLKNRQNK